MSERNDCCNQSIYRSDVYLWQLFAFDVPTSFLNGWRNAFEKNWWHEFILRASECLEKTSQRKMKSITVLRKIKFRFYPSPSPHIPYLPPLFIFPLQYFSAQISHNSSVLVKAWSWPWLSFNFHFKLCILLYFVSFVQ